MRMCLVGWGPCPFKVAYDDLTLMLEYEQRAMSEAAAGIAVAQPSSP